MESVRDYAIFLLDPIGRVVTWNEGAARINGYRADEIVGTHFSVFYPPEEADAGKPQYELVVAERTGRFEDEGWRVRKDGSRFWANVIITALRGPAGELRGFGKVTRDLTERKRAEDTARELAREQAARAAAEAAEQRVRESEERYRQISARLEVILQGVADGIVVLDRHARLTYANDAAARINGYANAAELLAAPLDEVAARFELLDENGAPFAQHRLPLRRALRGERPEPTVVRVRVRATGRESWLLLRASPVHDANGEVDLVVTILHDVTTDMRDREATRYLAQATAVLSESLDYAGRVERLAKLLVPELADWCAIDVVEQGQIVNLAVAHVDPAKVALARELQVRYPPDPLAPTGVPNVVRTGRSELYPEIPDELLVAGARDAEMLRILRDLGFRSAMVVPLRGHEATAFGAMTLISTDSGRRYDERDLALAEELGRRAAIAIDNARAYREAQEALRIRDEFMSVAGHELKTPLAALKLQLQSLERAFENGGVASDPARWSTRAAKTVGHVSRLERLVNELLDVSRITAGRVALDRETFDLEALVRDVVERHADEIARSGSKVSIERRGEPCGAWDRGRIDQVVTNLLSNAVKYGRGEPIAIVVERDGDVARLAVRDRGIGIDPEDRERIFGRFERAVSDRHYGGLGLGLWIVRELVLAHGGSVRHEGRDDGGSTFIVELPCNGGTE